MRLHRAYRRELESGLGSLDVSLVDLSDLCFTRECKERNAQVELQKQQILANALQASTKNIVDDTKQTIEIVKYSAMAIGAVAVVGLIIYATKSPANTKSRRSG